MCWFIFIETTTLSDLLSGLLSIPKFSAFSSENYCFVWSCCWFFYQKIITVLGKSYFFFHQKTVKEEIYFSFSFSVVKDISSRGCVLNNCQKMASSVTKLSGFLLWDFFNICFYLAFNAVHLVWFLLWYLSVPDKIVLESLTSIPCED